MKRAPNKKYKPLGLGLIGAGEFGHFASKVLDRAKGFRLAGVADISEPAARRIAKAYGVRKYPDYQALLTSPEITLVMINTPNDLHKQMAIETLRAGKHLFCEKPIATSLPDVRKIYKAAQTHRRLVGVDLVLRTNQFYDFLKKTVPKLGRLRSMSVNNQATETTIKTQWYWDDKRSGGWFPTADIHFYDLFIHLGGSLQIKVTSAAQYRSKRSGRTTALALTARSGARQVLSVYHSFQSTGQLVSAQVGLEFDRAHVEISGWVPEKMRIISQNRLPQTRPRRVGSLWVSQLSLRQSRESEYHAMVRRGLENLVEAIRAKTKQSSYQDPQEIIASHRIAFKAQDKAVRIYA